MIMAMNKDDLKEIKEECEKASETYKSARCKYQKTQKDNDDKETTLRIYFAAYVKSLETLIEYFIVWIGRQIFDDIFITKILKDCDKKNLLKKDSILVNNMNIIKTAIFMKIIKKDEFENLKQMNDLRNRVLVHGYYQTRKNYDKNDWYKIGDEKTDKIEEKTIKEFIKIVEQKIKENKSNEK